MAWPGADYLAPALVLALLAGVIRGFHLRVGHMIDELSREQTKPNP